MNPRPIVVGALVAASNLLPVVSLRAQTAPHASAQLPDDDLQREAKELMKTVRPRAEWKKGEPIGRFIDTYYFNVVESDYSGPQVVPIKDGMGKLLAVVRRGFWEHFNIEGTGRVLDGRELNTSEAGTVVVDAPMGEGSCVLQAWRTMAVDSGVIPLGTVVRIGETVGLKLADGTVLDGYWRAEDTGGEVRDARVDLRYVETPATTCAVEKAD